MRVPTLLSSGFTQSFNEIKGLQQKCCNPFFILRQFIDPDHMHAACLEDNSMHVFL